MFLLNYYADHFSTIYLFIIITFSLLGFILLYYIKYYAFQSLSESSTDDNKKISKIFKAFLFFFKYYVFTIILSVAYFDTSIYYKITKTYPSGSTLTVSSNYKGFDLKVLAPEYDINGHSSPSNKVEVVYSISCKDGSKEIPFSTCWNILSSKSESDLISMSFNNNQKYVNN